LSPHYLPLSHLSVSPSLTLPHLVLQAFQPQEMPILDPFERLFRMNTMVSLPKTPSATAGESEQKDSLIRRVKSERARSSNGRPSPLIFTPDLSPSLSSFYCRFKELSSPHSLSLQHESSRAALHTKEVSDESLHHRNCNPDKQSDH
jgi:hypothetical protein